EWVIVQFATAKIGAILVNVNPAYRAYELKFALEKSGCQTLIMVPNFKNADFVSIFFETCPEAKAAKAGTLSAADLPFLKNLILIDKTHPDSFFGWNQILAMGDHVAFAELRQREAGLSFDDPINIQYTSGTTGHPKGAVLSHHNIVNNALLVAECMRIAPGDRICVPVPFYHCFGMVMGNMAAVLKASTIVIPAPHFDALRTLEAVAEERCSALPHTEIKIIDPATGKTVPRGTQGELCTRGYCVMKGYYNNEQATRAAVDPDGWLHTGDIAVMREDGYCRIAGRVKDMIIRGGENIYPREIEEFLYTCPGISEVQIVGIPSAKYGEEVAAWVKLQPGAALSAEEIRAFCSGKIASFKIPRYVKMVNEFPMTVTGKIQKFRMREIMIHELGLDETDRIETA